MAEAHSHIRTYTIVYIWLMLLMLATVLAWLVNLGMLNIVIAMTIAVIKGLLVALYFMHVRYSGRLVWIFSGAAFLWLGILLSMTFNDYATRFATPRRLGSTPSVPLLGNPPPYADAAPMPSAMMVENPEKRLRRLGVPPSTTHPITPQPDVLD